MGDDCNLALWISLTTFRIIISHSGKIYWFLKFIEINQVTYITISASHVKITILQEILLSPKNILNRIYFFEIVCGLEFSINIWHAWVSKILHSPHSRINNSDSQLWIIKTWYNRLVCLQIIASLIFFTFYYIPVG